MHEPATHDKMAGAYCKPWCVYCRRAPGIDCTDAARPTKWRRQIERNQLRRYLITMEDEMSWKVPPVTLERREAAEKQGYDATIRPYEGGWEIYGINGPEIEKGATQACTLDEITYMVRDYVATALDLYPDDDGTDPWTEDCIPVRLVLDLEPQHYTGTRLTTTEVHDKATNQPAALVEEVTWWLEAPGAR